MITRLHFRSIVIKSNNKGVQIEFELLTLELYKLNFELFMS